MTGRRNKKGQFVKGKRNPPKKGSTTTTTTKRNPPARARRNPPARARRNPSGKAIREVMMEALAAIGGGLVSFTGRSLLKRVITDPTARNVIDVGLPIATGAVLSQLAGKHAKAAAAGAFGDAGASVGLVISDAMRAGLAAQAAANPPIYWPNPPYGYAGEEDVAPLLAPAWLDPHRVTQSMGAAY